MALFRARRRPYRPSPRWGHSAASLGSRVIMWGGQTVDFLKIQGKPQNPSVVEVLDGLLEEWQQKTTSGAAPLPLYVGACATLGSSGYSCCGHDGTTPHNSLYKIESESNEWNILQPSNPADGPMPKCGCRMIVIDDDKLAIIGGYGKPSHPLQPGATFIRDTGFTDGSGWTNEFHLFHTKDRVWSSPNLTGDRPPPCSDFTFTAVDHNTAVFFAGNQAEVRVKVNDIFILDHRLMHWTKLNTHGLQPKGRASHAACCINYGTEDPVLLVSGGIDNDRNTLRDAWLLYITNATWKEVELPGVEQRCAHTITAISLVPGFTEVAMFGGCPKYDRTVSHDKLPKLADTVLVRLESNDVPSASGAPPTKECVVTGIATMDQLGTPERLREKLQKLREHGAFSGQCRTIADSEETRPLQLRITALEERVREAERKREEERRGREEAEKVKDEEKRRREELQLQSEERERELQTRLTQSEQGRDEEKTSSEEAERRREEAERGREEAERGRRESEAAREEAERGREEERAKAQENKDKWEEAERGRREALDAKEEAERRLEARIAALENMRELQTRLMIAERGREEAEGESREESRRREAAERGQREAEEIKEEAELRCADAEERVVEVVDSMRDLETRLELAERGRQEAERRAAEVERRADERATEFERQRREAENGRLAAERGRQNGERRRREAEDRLMEAEKRRADAERRVTKTEQKAAVRVNVAEQGRNKAENGRLEAERVRDQAQQSREEAEQRRKEAEEGKQDAENRREEAERVRREAERERDDAKRGMREAERGREEAELGRIEAERGREEAERGRRDAEAERLEAEREKDDAETRASEAERIAAERVTEAERGRREAENGRLAAERGREEAERGRREAEERAGRRQEDREPPWKVRRDEIELTEEKLGTGAWAVVKVAKFRGTRVAAKCLHEVITSDYNLRLFVREMNLAARVRHPNLLLFIGATLHGEPIILTELMPTSLRTTLERNALTPPQRPSIALDVTAALQYLHLTQPDPIIHRDISSANVLLEPRPNDTWRAKVSDYGSANFLQQVQTKNPGAIPYAAPEASTPSQQSPKMDVFSFGVLLLELYTGRFPDISDREDQIKWIQDRRVVRLIHQCTAEDRSKRPNSSEIIPRLQRL